MGIMPSNISKKYFFDTYALIEILKSSPFYVSYLDEQITTSIFNLTELFYIALKELGEQKAKEVYSRYKASAVEIQDEIIFEAMKFKLKHTEQNLSYADCIGYIYAKANGLKFLTGDKEFKGLANVEFVK
jgi:predicted nucleic acid-binding protein